MKTLYESILDIDIVDKTNQQTEDFLNYPEDIKKMFNVFWDEFYDKIQKKYDVDDEDIHTHQSKGSNNRLITRRKAIIHFNRQDVRKHKEFIQDITKIFKSSYKKIFKKTPPKKSIYSSVQTLQVDFMCDTEQMSRMMAATLGHAYIEKDIENGIVVVSAEVMFEYIEGV